MFDDVTRYHDVELDVELRGELLVLHHVVRVDDPLWKTPRVVSQLGEEFVAGEPVQIPAIAFRESNDQNLWLALGLVT